MYELLRILCIKLIILISCVFYEVYFYCALFLFLLSVCVF